MGTIKEHCLKLLEYPAIASGSLDSPETTIMRWQIIREKRPLRQIYDEWYRPSRARFPLATSRAWSSAPVPASCRAMSRT